MHHISTTPFGRRPVSAGLITTLQETTGTPARSVVNKWDIFRQISVARIDLGLPSGAMTVLNALLTFHQSNALEHGTPLTVFPSNRALSERAHHMPESTLRRHLNTLVTRGIIQRHDSPNGKRYAHRDRSGSIMRAFGFDLSPILHRAPDIAERAHRLEAEAAAMKQLRADISLMRRDISKLAEYGRDHEIPGDWELLLNGLDENAKHLRRKLNVEQLRKMTQALSKILTKVTESLDVSTPKMSGTDIQTERHHQRSEKELTERKKEDKIVNSVPLPIVLQACPDVTTFTNGPIRHWPDFIRASDHIKSMLGIAPEAYEMAKQTMGPDGAATVIACILQRIGEIKNPGGYLRALVKKAILGTFSVTAMTFSLLKAQENAPC